jgi:hypothetical protein
MDVEGVALRKAGKPTEYLHDVYTWRHDELHRPVRLDGSDLYAVNQNTIRDPRSLNLTDPGKSKGSLRVHPRNLSTRQVSMNPAIRAETGGQNTERRISSFRYCQAHVGALGVQDFWTPKGNDDDDSSNWPGHDRITS